jgi:hypothetical protein
MSRIAIAALIVTAPPFDARALGQVAGPQVSKTHVAKPAWLDATGKQLRIKLAGALRDERGAPANDCKLTVTFRTEFTRIDLPVAIKGNQFQVWVPVGDSEFHLDLNAASAGGRRLARETLSAFQLREAAIDGLELTIKPSERFVDVTVMDKSSPVRDASVVAEVGGVLLTSKTDGSGVARFALMKRDQLSQLSAWTDDFRVGGYAFHRDPPRDPWGSKFTVELDKCRPQVIRIINDENKSPIPDLRFLLMVGTGRPNYQFLGETPAREMKTDGRGEAVYRWFPDWKTQGSYVELPDPRWVKAAHPEISNGALVVRLKKSRFEARKPVMGRVESADNNVAGLFVEMWSFQGEEEQTSDVRYAFTDAQGRFKADYLPGSTYCIFVNDARYVSNIIDVMPYDPVTAKMNTPSLTLSEGRPVEVAVTSGPTKAPVAYQWVQLETPHEYSWKEKGRTRNGGGGRRWWVTTDAQGKARTFALPGAKVEGSLYTPDWRLQKSADVKDDGVTRLDFHREVAAARKVKGRLRLPGDVAAELKDAVVEIGAIDGETHERLTRKANKKGEFSFESKASRIGLYARTKDSKAAAVAVVEHLDRPLELTLQATGEFRGKLLGKGNQPLKGHTVRAAIRVGKSDFSKAMPTSFQAAVVEATTNGEGNYSFSGLPCETTIMLFANSLDRSRGETLLDEFYITPHESRPRMVSRLGRPEREPTTSFAERYRATLRDCRLSNYGPMVILFQPSEDAKKFVDANFMDYEANKDVMAFMQIKGPLAGKSAAEISELAHSNNWPLPDKGKVVALAMDPQGRELGRIEIEVKDPAAPKRAADFIRQHASAPADARHKWDEAFALARQSGRKVWVRISQRYCGPCFMLTRWLDDQKKLLEQDYVFLKIDDVRDLHGEEVAERLNRGEGQGVPFHAIFDASGKMLITSESPLGNIGHPGGYEGKRHLRKMLLATRSKLTDRQVDELVNSLGD